MRRIGAAVGTAAAVALVAGCGSAGTSTAASHPATPHAPRPSVPMAAAAAPPAFVGFAKERIGPAEIAVTCAGRTRPGRPSVVFLTGMGAPQKVFTRLRAEVAQRTHVCTYDRPGDGGRSSHAPRVETLASSAAQLSALLHRVRVRGPVVLVGHSVGGLLAGWYAGTHPRAVAGAVLLDATPPSMIERTLATIPDDDATAAGWARAQMQDLVAGTNSEHFRFHDQPFRSLGDRPLVVISHAPGLFAGIAGYGADLDRFWSAGQRAWAGLSTHSQLIVTTAGHDVYRDRPALTLHAIDRVVAQASRHR